MLVVPYQKRGEVAPLLAERIFMKINQPKDVLVVQVPTRGTHLKDVLVVRKPRQLKEPASQVTALTKKG